MRCGAPARLIVLVLLVVLTGCRPIAGDDGGPPPSGWPQPAGDRVTEKPATADARPVAHEIRVRRGALILGITLSGVRGKKEQDPRSVHERPFPVFPE
jgi:hypothetical protein